VCRMPFAVHILHGHRKQATLPRGLRAGNGRHFGGEVHETLRARRITRHTGQNAPGRIIRGLRQDATGPCRHSQIGGSFRIDGARRFGRSSASIQIGRIWRSAKGANGQPQAFKELAFHPTVRLVSAGPRGLGRRWA